MGSGKTTIGMALARTLSIDFVDTDELIKIKTGKDIKDIFASEGEQAFREYERDVLLHTPARHCIVATGGGIVERMDNRQWLADKRVVYLQASWESIAQRLKEDQSRPIWADQTRDKQALLESRLSKYLEIASYTINTEQLSPQKIVDQIISFSSFNYE